MSSIQIYHNPRCSKSRQTLELLEKHGVKPEIVLYLETAPKAKEIQALVDKLGFDSVRKLIRTGEDAYKENNLKDTDLTEQQLISVMEANPKLIQRPIVVNGNRAAIGRPPESVLEII